MYGMRSEKTGRGNNERRISAARWARALCFAAALTWPGANVVAGSSESRLSDKPQPYLSDEDLPARTAPLLEIGDLFLGRGNLKPGFELPTGAVWQPRFWVYGSGRTSLQTFDQGRGGGQVSEWANRLDLFGNLQLTGTERVLIGVTPLHRDAGFSGHTFEPDSREGTDNELNFRIRTLFFEGDIAELFPRWDYNDSTTNDIGFSIGRQAVVFQDGVLISDTIDAVGLTRNNVRFTGVPWLVNLRTTVLYAWDEIHRDDNTEDHDAQLFGLFNQIDTPFSTFNFDLVYVDSSSSSGDDVLTGAVDAVQRFGKLSTTFRVAGSYAPDLKTRTSNDGVLLFADVNWTPAYTFNIAYITAFAGFNDFTSAARDPLAGGPLGRTGLLFSGRGIGTYPSPMSNRGNDAYGAAIGYQILMDGLRRQLVLEAGVRKDDTDGGFDAAGIAARLQQAVGQRTVLTLEGFGTAQENNDDGYGLRSEILVKF
jgi:hypothetical protein